MTDFNNEPSSQPLSQHTLLKDERTILDNVHKSVTFPTFFWELIDCPEFQRLRNIKQLGMGCYYVFPGATHTRFEHCIGTGYLANKMINILQKFAPKGIISENDVQNVTIAGLLHDIGHAVNSHGFEHNVIRALAPTCKWSHEEASGMLLDHIVDKYYIDLSKEDINKIKAMIKGEKPPATNPERFLYEIVSNEDNSVDVDKFDYLCRDSYNVGIKTVHFDYNRLIESSRVIEGEVCFHSKNDYNVYGLFQSRYKLFKDIYTEKTSAAIDYMVADALLEASGTFKYLDCIYDPAEYLKLTDCLLEYIEHSNKPGLRKSRDLLRRIKKRDLYEFVGEIILSEEMDMRYRKITAEQIVSHSTTLRPEDVVVSNFYLNYGRKDRNPVDSVYFYNSSSATPFHIDITQTSLILPEMFQERYVRVYAKRSDQISEVNEAFLAYCKKNAIPIEDHEKDRSEGIKYRKVEEAENGPQLVLPRSKRARIELGAGHVLINN